MIRNVDPNSIEILRCSCSLSDLEREVNNDFQMFISDLICNLSRIRNDDKIEEESDD